VEGDRSQAIALYEDRVHLQLGQSR
jgi:hypothetical protein